MQRVDLGTRYVYVPEEFCPCAPCWELDPCECPSFGRVTVYGNIFRRHQSWDQDSSGVGNTWFYGGAEKTTPGAPVDVAGTFYAPFTLGGGTNTTEASGDIFCSPATNNFGITNTSFTTFGVNSASPNYTSTECDPDKWRALGRGTVSDDDWTSLLATTRQSVVHVPDPALPVEACCDPATTSHECPLLMKATIGGYEMYSLAGGLTGAGGFYSLTFTFSAETREYNGTLIPHNSTMQNGFSLIPGYGPSIVPNPTIGTGTYEDLAEARIFLQVTIFPSTHGTPGVNLTNVSIRQYQPTSTFLNPSVGYAEDLWTNSFATPTPYIRNKFIPAPSGVNPCDMFPLNVTIPLWYRTWDPGVPGYVISSIGSTNLNLQFVDTTP